MENSICIQLLSSTWLLNTPKIKDTSYSKLQNQWWISSPHPSWSFTVASGTDDHALRLTHFLTSLQRCHTLLIFILPPWSLSVSSSPDFLTLECSNSWYKTTSLLLLVFLLLTLGSLVTSAWVLVLLTVYTFSTSHFAAQPTPPNPKPVFKCPFDISDILLHRFKPSSWSSPSQWLTSQHSDKIIKVVLDSIYTPPIQAIKSHQLYCQNRFRE